MFLKASSGTYSLKYCFLSYFFFFSFLPYFFFFLFHTLLPFHVFIFILLFRSIFVLMSYTFTLIFLGHFFIRVVLTTSFCYSTFTPTVSPFLSSSLFLSPLTHSLSLFSSPLLFCLSHPPLPFLPSLFSLSPISLFLHLCRYPQLTEFGLASFGKKQIVTVEAFCSALSSYLCDGKYVRTCQMYKHVHSYQITHVVTVTSACWSSLY